MDRINKPLKRILGNTKELDGEFDGYVVSDLGYMYTTKSGYLTPLKSYEHSNGGYDIYTLSIKEKNENGRQKNRKIRAHRIVYEAFTEGGIPEDRPYINHLNGNVHDNSIENLMACTAEENMRHSSRVLGRKIPLEETALTSLTNQDVLKIYELCYTTDLSLQAIGDMFGVSRTAVSNIKYGVTWGDVTGHNKLQPVMYSSDPNVKLERPGDVKEYAKGERIASSKLTSEQVLDIYARIHGGESVYVLSAQYGVCIQTIYDIKNGVTWSHVTDHVRY